MGGEEQKTGTPFFGATKKTPIRKKKGGSFFQPMDGPVVQRLATSKEDEKLGTNDARMEKDKEEPEKPVYTKQMPGDKKEKEKKGIRRAADEKKKKKKGPGGGGPGTGGMIRKKAEHMASEDVSAEIAHQAGKGSPLPANTLAEMNKAFGMDFGQVRIHCDGAAARLCQELHAQAFTHGMDIYFNESKYNPDSTDGKQLLAHELTHVAQQSGHSKASKKQ